MLLLNREDWNTYLTGAHYIQNIFADLSASEREMIMTGICQKCWDSWMSESEDEDDPYDDNYDYPEVGIDE